MVIFNLKKIIVLKINKINQVECSLLNQISNIETFNCFFFYFINYN